MIGYQVTTNMLQHLTFNNQHPKLYAGIVVTVANRNSSYEKGMCIPHTGSFKLEVRKTFVTASVSFFLEYIEL